MKIAIIATGRAPAFGTFLIWICDVDLSNDYRRQVGKPVLTVSFPNRKTTNLCIKMTDAIFVLPFSTPPSETAKKFPFIDSERENKPSGRETEKAANFRDLDKKVAEAKRNGEEVSSDWNARLRFLAAPKKSDVITPTKKSSRTNTTTCPPAPKKVTKAKANARYEEFRSHYILDFGPNWEVEEDQIRDAFDLLC